MTRKNITLYDLDENLLQKVVGTDKMFNSEAQAIRNAIRATYGGNKEVACHV